MIKHFSNDDSGHEKAYESYLTKLVLAYQRSGEGKARLRDEVYQFIYLHPVHSRRLAIEQAGEFLLFMHPRIDRLITRFRYQGHSFEHYLKVTIYWQLKTYLRKVRKKEHREQIMYPIIEQCTVRPALYDPEEMFFRDSAAEESIPAYRSASDIFQTNDFARSREKRSLLIYALNSAADRPAEWMFSAAAYLSIDPVLLSLWIIELRDSLSSRYEKIQQIDASLSATFCSLIELRYEIRAKSMQSGDLQIAGKRLKQTTIRIERQRIAYRKACGRIRYKSIADLLDLSVEAVTTSMHYCKKNQLADRIDAFV